MIQFSMYLQSAHLYRRLIHRLSTNIDSTIRQYSKITDKKETNDHSKIKSTRFSDYKVVYTFPHIRYAVILNKVKYRHTIFVGACVLSTIGLQMLDIMSKTTGLSIIYCLGTMICWIHAISYVCNNLVGFIYFKEDGQEVILSYLNYWGERTDLRTNITNISPLSEIPSNIGSNIYRKLNIKSCNKKLKLSIKYGNINDIKHFKTIFGSYK